MTHYATEPETRAALENRILYNMTHLVSELLQYNQHHAVRMEQYPNIYEFDFFASVENATEPLSPEELAEVEENGASDFDEDRGYRDREVLEWWLVERGLFETMRERGLVVLEAGGLTLWGRTTSGQVWSQDEELRALVGSWQKH